MKKDQGVIPTLLRINREDFDKLTDDDSAVIHELNLRVEICQPPIGSQP